MDMKNISSGRLRAIGYDPGRRVLRIRFDDDRILEYQGIGQELWRRLSQAASPWSVYRDNIEEEFAGRPISRAEGATPRKNPLDDLF